MDDIIRIMESPENSALLIDWVSETVRHEIKNQESGSLVILLKNLVAEKVQVKKMLQKLEMDINLWILWVKIFSSTLFPLRNIEITSYEPRFNGVFPRDNLPRIKGEACIINLDDKKGEVTHWVSLFNDRNNVVYLDSFGMEYIPQLVLSNINNSQHIQNTSWWFYYVWMLF